MPLQSICVFAGSSTGSSPSYRAAAADFGRLLVERGIHVVYGGGNIGLMGVVADAALAAGGKVTGVIPRALVDMEVAHDGLTELHVVETMHQRKALMAELSDGIVALPGGLGTLEELFETLTWVQLGFLSKPSGLLNVSGYYDHLLHFLDRSVAQRFVSPVHRALLINDVDAVRLLDRMETCELPQVAKPIDPART